MIYLDNAATTFPKPESVYIAMDKANREHAVNAGRGSYRAAREANRIITETKQLLRDLIKVDINAAVVLAPSITIALNQIINGLDMRKGSVIYVSPYEHNAVARTVNKVALEKGIVVKEIPIDEQTLAIDLEKMKYEFSKDRPEFVFCTHVSNVTGYILPVQDIFAEAKKYGAITILDSAQSLGLIEIRASVINADIIAFAGHKTLYGPLGIGGFINISGIPLSTFITGGTGSDSLNLKMPDGAETHYEAASSNIVAIYGLYAALKTLNISENRSNEMMITRHLVKELNNIPRIKMFLPNEENHTGIISFIFDGMSSADLGQILDEDFDIAVRTGYHCAPFIHKYLKDESSLGTVRVGIGKFTTMHDVDCLVSALKELANE
ncbi:aminotransferase class V-fold PLP-dependent enzyme [Lachnospira multipara]|uniref:Cysteine desulfurase family protein n=1 Tax=Lachnospira multipara TaxID=28051 RepID=A0A1H5S5M2_9FIRM|nr:aminotransferase class V-fold PLP-dependent enzyme [Lachnospira multipara]SEF45107.1 cysteine desulfurase family protein [Lachnospira multipara]